MQLHRFGFILILTAMLLGMNGGVINAQVVTAVPQNQYLFSESGLNPDESLHLSDNFSRSLEFADYDVTLNPEKAPAFNLSSGTINWEAIGNNGAGDGAVSGSVKAIAISGTDVYIGGSFTQVNNQGTIIPEAAYIAKWDGTNWSALGSDGAGGGSLNGIVEDIFISGGNIYVGGSFSNVNNNGTVLNEADYVARWDGTNWSALGSDGAGDGSLSSSVYSIYVDGSNVFVGGVFTNVNNNGSALNAADYIARWDGTNWSALGTGFGGDGSLGSDVYSMDMIGADLYVGGAFTNVTNNGTVIATADAIARWDGTDWSAVGNIGGNNGALSGMVIDLVAIGSDLYAGGSFNVYNNDIHVPEAVNIAKWDGSDWTALGSDGSGGPAINGNVIALSTDGTILVIGGYFSNVNNNGTVINEADYIARWDGTNWSAMGSNNAGNGSLNSSVGALDYDGVDLFVGGMFLNVNNNGTVLNAADYLVKTYSDTTDPLVNNTDIQASYSATGPTSFNVTFNEDMNDPNGNDGVDDVTNPANYLLLEQGSPVDFQTADCANRDLVKDTQIIVDSVTFNNTNFTATLNTNGGQALPIGKYRLHVCGTTSIRDLAGNAINGGLDSVFNFVISAAGGGQVGQQTTSGTVTSGTVNQDIAEVLPATGFAPGRITKLPDQPQNQEFSETGIVIEIPSMQQSMNIVGVPRSENSWNVAWLGDNAGWLDGSAFPTWEGNTIITGHVWDSFNRPGPFAQLKTLQYGDLIMIHAWGKTYTYEVRESSLVFSGNVRRVVQHEENDWVTLVTCEFFNPLNNGYLFRRVVRAVLMRVD